MSIKVTYEVRRIDTRNFHGWAIFECSEFMEEEYYRSSSMEDVRAVLSDLVTE